MHWYDITEVDPETSELLNPEEFYVLKFLNQMEFEFPENCNGETAELEVFVNYNKREELLSYQWKDGDKLKITFE